MFEWSNDNKLFSFWPSYTLAAVLVSVVVLRPRWLLPVHFYWSKFAYFINSLLVKILLGFVFFVFITPTGMIKRKFGADALKDIDTYPNSYRQKSEPSDMEFPF